MNFSQWLIGARPKTWPNAVAPVLAGSAAAIYYHHFSLLRAILALLVAWCLIVAVNFANDYSDGVRGTDEFRTGPQRLTAGGLVDPKAVKYTCFLFMGLACIFGLVLSIISAPWLIIVGALCCVAAWFYTGGKNPYGYRGLGEVSVFIFFGLVAVLGTEYVQAKTVSLLGLGLAIAIGCFSSSVNLANNLRDIPEDMEAGKITLAVRLGDSATRRLYLLLNFIPFVVTIIWAIFHPLALIALCAVILAFIGSASIRKGKTGAELIPAIASTGKTMLVWSILILIASVFH